MKVIEMSDAELERQTGGLGVIETIVVGIVVGASLSIINNWDSFKAGLMGEPDPAKASAKA